MRVLAKAALTGVMMVTGVGCMDKKWDAPVKSVSENGSGAITASAAPAKGPYFEVPGKDGKTTYLFGSPESMQAYMKEGKLPEMKKEEIKGQSVAIEAASADRLKKEYESQHK